MEKANEDPSEKKKNDTKSLRVALNLPAIAITIYVIIRVMLYFNQAQIIAKESYGAYELRRYPPFFIYSIIPIVSGYLLQPLAKKLTDFEQHQTYVCRRYL